MQTDSHMSPEIQEQLHSIQERIGPSRSRLVEHPIYESVDSIDSLREFMRLHVFAVWDFMSLAKRLQREYTCVDLPWTPPRDPEVARFINEVVLGEESDVGLDGRPASHLEMYLAAMREVGSSTVEFEAFLERVIAGQQPDAALGSIRAPRGAREFVRGTIRCALESPIVEVAAEFLYGREDVIPDMFERLLTLWPGGEEDVPLFAYYLRRHIELDGDEHGPLAERLLAHAATQTPDGWERASVAAERAVERRCELWSAFTSRTPTGSLR